MLPIDHFHHNQIYSDVYSFICNVTTLYKITFTKINSKSKAAIQDELEGEGEDSKNEGEGKSKADLCKVSQDSYKFYRKRRYLFSKYDLGIELDNESWYSVTPESVGEYIAQRVVDKLGSNQICVLDAFSGCGGNVIQFGKLCKKVYGCEIDEAKIQYCQNNCKIYGINNYKILLKDYLESKSVDFDNNKISAVFLSPPWGGVGYTQMEKYTFEYMHPNFNDTLSKSLEFSKNLILYIPRNTDVSEICSVLSIYASEMNELGRSQEVIFEIERLGHYSGSTSVLVIYTGDLANITDEEVVDHLCEEYLNLPQDPTQAEICKNSK